MFERIMAGQIHYLDSEPILQHEEMAEEMEAEESKAEDDSDPDDNIVVHEKPDSQATSNRTDSLSYGCHNPVLLIDQKTSDEAIPMGQHQKPSENTSELSEFANGNSPVASKPSFDSTSDPSENKKTIVNENTEQMTRPPAEIEVESRNLAKDRRKESLSSNIGDASVSDHLQTADKTPVKTRGSRASENSSGAEDDGKDRAFSIPLHATVLRPPPLQATAVFYDEDEEGICNGNGGGGGGGGGGGIDKPPNGIVVDGTPGSQLASLRSTNELRNFAVSVEADSSYQPSSFELDAQDKAIQWDLNYQEAAIYLEEGDNNDKFDTHPRDQASLPAYQMVHNNVFYVVELVFAVLLMSLAFLEEPSVFHPKNEEQRFPPFIHGIMELIFLIVISLESIMKMRWMGFHVFVRHRRSMFKVLVLFVVSLEAIVVIWRSDNHIRLTRALRPLFLMDCRYARGVRRFVRQILLTLPPVIEMSILLLFFNFIFAILGNSIFSSSDQFFGTLRKSFVSLFVLFSSANYPDVMMKNYAESPWSFLFFLAYIIITLYKIIKLLLAVVVITFNYNEEEKLKGLLLHRREASRRAFQLLNSKSNPNQVSIKHFAGLMRYFSPSKTTQHVYLSFKVLNKSETGLLTLDEFMHIYEVSKLKWKEKKKQSGPWFNHVNIAFLRKCGETVGKFVKRNAFKNLVFLVLFANAVAKALTDLDDAKEIIAMMEKGFLAFYILEAFLKMFGLGPTKYFKSSWNSFDFFITVLATCILIWEAIENKWLGNRVHDYTQNISNVVNVLRPLRLLRLFKYRKRYRDVFATVFVLLPTMASVGTVLILLYYSFAIVGMEIFHPSANQTVLTDCCVNSSVENSYKNNSGFYYVNNFDNILRSVVTLFELTVVNNWFIIMDGFAYVTEYESTRLFFMLFYLMTMVVMNIVVASILATLTHRIDYRRIKKIVPYVDKNTKEEDALLRVPMSLMEQEIRMIKVADDTFEDWKKAIKAMKGSKSVDRPPPPLADDLHGSFIRQRKERRVISGVASASSAFGSASVPFHVNAEDSVVNGINFQGSRSRRKLDFLLEIYAKQVEDWFMLSDAANSTKECEGTPLRVVKEWRKSFLSTETDEGPTTAD